MWLVLAVPLVVVLVGAWSYRWVDEDAFINFRIIGNIFAGHGPVFNVGERVEVYSDPMWVLALALLHGVLPFASLEWLSVVLGLVTTAFGVVLAGRAIQRLGSRRADGLVLPLGLLVFSVVAGVWEFSTSGLEMGMVFCWIGLSFWLLVRTEERRDQHIRCAFVMGLGPLIRPELVLMAAVFLVALGLVIAAPGWQGPPGRLRRFGNPLVAALCLPVLYELWRMSYFAMVVSNTGLAKSGASSWWSQGATYLWNFGAPYTLWLPFLLALPLMAPRIRRWWQQGDRIGVLVLLTPAFAGCIDALYVTRLGGDYMHARLLLPAFFGLCLGIFIQVADLRTLLLVPFVGIICWSLVCAFWLRTSAGDAFLGIVNGISNARTTWIQITGNPHPVTLNEWSRYTTEGQMFQHAAMAARRSGHQSMIIEQGGFGDVTFATVNASSALPVSLIAPLVNIGSDGLVSGPDVYVYDTQSLANPVGSHTEVTTRQRAGGKNVTQVWMVARFGLPGDAIPASVGSAQSIEDAREAIGCGSLNAYLHSITAPMSITQAMSNIVHSWTYATMTFSSVPRIAKNQLCR
jgi:arabinofuranosyltransferase